MSFDSDERSVQSSRPRELWLIVTSTQTFRYTTAEVDVVYDGHTWTAIPASRSEIGGASVGDAPEITLTMPISNPFFQAYAFGMPEQSIELTIYRLQGAAVMTWWEGPISDFAVEKGEGRARSPSNLADALDATIPCNRIQRQCNHMLYDTRCTVDRTTVANKLTTTVVSVSTDGLSIVVASIGGLGGHLKGGEIWRTANGDKRTIADQVGTTLSLEAPFRTIGAGNGIQLYRGCKHDVADCGATFANTINFGGHPYIPTVNPWKGDLRGNPWS